MSVFRPVLVPIAVLALSLVAMGCAGARGVTEARPELPGSFPNHTLAQIQAQLRPPSADTLRSFRAKASLAVRARGRSVNASADLRHARGDSLYMTVSPGMGIEAARVLVTPDSFYVYDRINQELTYGSLAYATQFLPVPLAPEDAFLILLGLNPPDATTGWTLEADSSHYLLRSVEGDRLAVVDPSIWRIVRYEQRTPEGDLIEQRQYSAFAEMDGLFLPRRIIVRRPQDAANAIIYYRDFTLNPEPLSFPFRVKDGVKRILVDRAEPTGASETGQD